METNNAMSTDKATFVIQVNPQGAQNTVIGGDGQQARGACHNTALTEFFKAEPKALGTVQIMIGVVCFLFGIVRTTFFFSYYFYPTILAISGITFWGSLIYISAGSLSVAAQNKLHPCVVKASLGMNVISAVTAGIAIVLTSLEIALGSYVYRECYYAYDRDSSRHSSGHSQEICFNLMRFDLGISGILLLFSILQFIISICISGFACKGICNTDFAGVNVALNRGY